MKDLRRIDRQSSSWAGTCRLAGEPAASGRECRVIDISTFGVAISFDHPAPLELRPGRLVFLDFLADGGAVSLHLEGEIRNVAPAVNGGVRVGVEFLAFSKRIHAINALLETMNDDLLVA